MKITDDFHYAKEAIMWCHQINTFTDSKYEWNTKENTLTSIKNVFYVLWYAKRHHSGWSDFKQ